MIASWAATQDLDAVFLFAYAHSNHLPNPSEHAVTNFFDIGYNPAKWCMMKAGSLIFQRLIPPFSVPTVLNFAQFSGDPKTALPELARLQNAGIANVSIFLTLTFFKSQTSNQTINRSIDRSSGQERHS